MNKIIYIFLSVFFLSITSRAQHNFELCVKGDMAVQKDAIVSVMGDVHIAGALGRLGNSGEIEVQGNWTKEAAAQHLGNYQGMGTGVVYFRNEDVNTSESQYIYGNMTGANAFYNVLIDNRAPVNQDNMVFLADGDAEVSNLLRFAAGRIRTDRTTHSDQGADYAYTLHVSNPDPASISGHYMSGVTRYVEGKLARQVEGARTYDFPIGIDPAVLDGEESFQLRFTNADNDRLDTWFQRGTQPIVVTDYVNFDMGRDPFIVGGAMNPFYDCTDGPDGVLDQAMLTCERSHEWVVNKSNPAANFRYSIEVFPGPIFDDPACYATSVCGGNTQQLKWLAKDGVPGGTPIDLAGVSVPPTTSGNTGWGTLATPCDPTGNVLNQQEGFSIFRLHGNNDLDRTELPIKLIMLKATPIENQYIRVDWATSMEQNSKHFVVERSTDAVHFQPLATQPAAGTSYEPRYYHLDDHHALPNTVYYYRIQSVDLDETTNPTHIVSAVLHNNNVVQNSILLYPNPTRNQDGVNISVQTTTSQNVSFVVYDAVGKRIYTQQIPMNAGLNIHGINTSGWAAAAYMVQIIGNSFSQTLPFVVSE